MTWKEFKHYIDRRIKEECLEDVEIQFIDISGPTLDKRPEEMVVSFSKDIRGWSISVC